MTGRERLLLDPAWRFHRGDLPFPQGHAGWTKAGNFRTGPTAPGLNDSAWRQVDLSHDFIVEGEFRQAMEAGARMAATMKRVVRRLDPTRPVTMAMSGGWNACSIRG